MKKINYLIIILITFFTISLNCNATSNTYTRTTDNLLVPNDVKVDSNSIKSILNTPAVSATEKIYDFANLIDDSQEKKIVDKITKFSKRNKMDIVIVTTNDLKGFQLPEYTYNFYDYNDFLQNGVTLVIYTGGNSPEIFMGNSGEKDGFIFKTYNETRINQTLSYVYNNHIKNKDYYGACDKYVDIIIGFYATDMKKQNGGSLGGGPINWLEIVILSVALAFICNILLISKLRKYQISCKKGELLDRKVVKSTLVISQKQDIPFNDNAN